MTQEEMAMKLTEVDQRSKSNTHRINELSGQIDAVNRLATSVEVLVQENKHQTEAIKEIKQDVANLDDKVDAIEQKPAKRWDGMVEKVIYGLVGALVAALGAGLIHILTVAA